ncbi:MAG: hypothetical protein QOC72_2209, partial [Methylobacteriaceae bacterium]|nr:hypothetical protein [Methylobacteriaceae bacterium]
MDERAATPDRQAERVARDWLDLSGAAHPVGKSPAGPPPSAFFAAQHTRL